MSEEVTQPDPDEPILVGFSPHTLEELLSWVGTDRESEAAYASVKWPAWYRPYRLCSEDDLQHNKDYLEWLSALME